MEGMSEGLQGTILVLIDDEYCTRGMGIWEGLDRQRKEDSLMTPLDDFRGIRNLQVGDITLTIKFLTICF